MTTYTSSTFAVRGIGDGLGKAVASLGISVRLAEPACFGTNFSATSHPSDRVLDDDEPARQAGRDFPAHAVRGNLDRSMSAIADIAAIANPPRRLAVGNYGLAMVNGKLAELEEGYTAWGRVTLTT